MRNPFSLLTKGLILAICWWVALSLAWMHPVGILEQVWPRLLFCLAGISIAGLAASLILLNQRESLRLILEPSHYWGVNVTLGRFPVADERPPRRDGKVLSLLKSTQLEPAVSELLARQNADIQSLLNALLGYIAGSDQDKALLHQAWQTCSNMQDMAKTFSYRGLLVRKIPPANPSFCLDADDNLIPVMAFAHHLGVLMRINIAIDDHQCASLSVRLLTRTAEVRNLSFNDQHILYQVLGHYLNPEKLPVNRVKDSITLRDDRIVALVELLRAAIAYSPNNALKAVDDIKKRPVTLEKSAQESVHQPTAIHKDDDTDYNTLYELLNEPFRVNGSKASLRLGLLHGDYVYLITEKVLESMRTPDGDSQQDVKRKQDIINALDAKGMLYQKANQQDFNVQFRGVIKDEEKTNNYYGMIIFAWRKKMPLLASRGDSLFVPRILDEDISEKSDDAPNDVMPANSIVYSRQAVVSSDDLWAIEEAEAQQSCDDRVIKLQFEPSPKELELIRKAIYDELSQLVSLSHPLIATLHDGQEQWLCVSVARVASQEVPVSVQHIALLLKHQASVVGLRVSKNEKGSTILSFARA
ncbi:hypothetical protein FK216_14510 [Moraxellaceae bacterium AER2_44_116]|nr:hypothetical protein FK216_14510 [Moraxellaceae bacterium AER2_44_116]